MKQSDFKFNSVIHFDWNKHIKAERPNKSLLQMLNGNNYLTQFYSSNRGFPLHKIINTVQPFLSVEF